MHNEWSDPQPSDEEVSNEEGQQLAVACHRPSQNQQQKPGDLVIGASLSGKGQQLQTVAARDAAEYNALKREYKGLEAPLTGAPRIEAGPVVQGRTGRAAGYVDEPANQ